MAYKIGERGELGVAVSPHAFENGVLLLWSDWRGVLGLRLEMRCCWMSGGVNLALHIG